MHLSTRKTNYLKKDMEIQYSPTALIMTPQSRGGDILHFVVREEKKKATLYLCSYELFETVDGHPSPQDPSDCGEARVVPAKEAQQSVKTPTKSFTRKNYLPNLPSVHVSLLHKPGELPLGQHGVVEVESGVLPDVRFPDAQGVDEPIELLVTVVVLGGPEGMGHALQTVHNGAGKVVGRVDSEGKGVAGFKYPDGS